MRAVLNSALAVILVVGLTPTLSFAGEETVTVRTADGEMQQQAVEQVVPELDGNSQDGLSDEVQTAGPVADTEKAIASVAMSAAEMTGGAPMLAADGENDATINVEFSAAPVPQTLDESAAYFNESLTITATVTDADFASGTIEVKRGGDVVKTQAILASGSPASVVIDSDDTKDGAVTVEVTATDSQTEPQTKTYVCGTTENGSSSQDSNPFTLDKPIKVNAKPTVSVSWAVADKGAISDTTALIPSGVNEGDDCLVATITVTDATLLESPVGDRPVSGEANKGIALTASGTTNPATFSAWTGASGVYTCTATFPYQADATARIDATVTDNGTLSADALTGNEMKMVADALAPEIGVTWTNPTTTETFDSRVWYGGERTATVTITDVNGLDLSGMTVTANGGTVSTIDKTITSSPCTFTVTYAENNIDTENPCTLKVEGVKDRAGNLATDKTETSFQMLVTPIVEITSATPPGATMTDEVVYGGDVAVDFSVKTLAWPATDTGLISLSNSEGVVATGEAWSVGAWRTEENGYEHKATATITAADTYTSLKFVSNGSVSPAIPETVFKPSGDIVKFTIDKTPPELSVVWTDDVDADKNTLGSSVYYGKTREATITISDDHGFSAEQWAAMKGNIVVTGGTLANEPEASTVANKTYVIKAAFTGNTDASSLQIANVKNAAGIDMKGAVGTEVDDTTHTYKDSVDGFKMLTVPTLTVTRSPSTGGESDGTTYYTDPFEVTLGLHALPSQLANVGVTAAAAKTPLNDATGSAAWTAASVAETNLDYTCALEFNEATGAFTNAITVSGKGGLKFIPPTSNDIDDATDAYTFTPTTFAVDNTPPTLAVGWIAGTSSDAEKPITEKVVGTLHAQKRYYGGGDSADTLASATLTITEANPLVAKNIVVKYGDGTAEADLSMLTPATGGVYVLTHDYKGNLADGEYVITVEGNGENGAARDLSGKLLSGPDVVSGVYKATVVIDRKAPKITAQYVDSAGSPITVIDSAGSEASGEFDVTGSTYYYSGEAAKLRVFVEEKNFDAANTKVNGEVPSEGWMPVSTAPDNIRYYADIDVVKAGDPEQGADKAVPVTVSASDLAANPASFTVNTVADKKPPVVDVKYYVDYGTPSQAIVNPKDGVRYANKKVTAEIAVTDEYFDKRSDKTVITTGGTKATEWTDEANGRHVITYEFDVNDNLDEAFELSLEAKDMATNSASYPESGVDKVVIDKKKPAITSIEYYKGDVKLSPNTDGAFYANGEMTVMVTVNEKYFDQNGTASLITVDGASAQGLEWDDSDKDNDNYVATFTLDSTTEKQFSIKAEAVDRATNKSDATTGMAVVDKVAPKLTVAFDVCQDIEMPKSAGEIRYYDNAVTATITVEDTFVNDADIRIDAPGAIVGTWDASDATKPSITVTFPAVQGEERDYNLTVTGKDKAGNQIESGKEDTFVSNEPTHTYRSEVIVDQKNPVLNVAWDNTDVQNGKYYKAERTPTITVDEKYFKPANLLIDGVATSAEDWDTPDGSTLHTYKNAKTYKDGVHNLKISGTDFSKNPLEGADNANPSRAADATGAYDSEEFVVDTVLPVVTVRMSQPLANAFAGTSTDYFRLGSTLTATVSVEELHFDPVHDDNDTRIVVSGTNTADYADTAWNDGEYSFAFTPNDAYGAAERNTLSVVAYDLAGNSVEFAYGDPASARARAIDSANNTLSGSGSFALDVTAPVIVPGNGINIPSRNYSNNYSDTLLFYKDATTLRVVVNDALGIEDIVGEGSDYGFSAVAGGSGDKSWSLDVTLRNGAEFTDAFTLTARDVAHNVRTWKINPKTLAVDDITTPDSNTPLYGEESDLYPLKLILDTTAPRVDLTGATPGQYYNTTQAVTTTVTELNFDYLRSYDPGQVVTTMTKQEGNAGRATSVVTVSTRQFEGSGSVFSNTMMLADDGHYSFYAHVTDPAGNEGQATLAEFTIDKTAPVIQDIVFDNNDVRNGKYYRASRTATITIVEHNWDPSLVTITTNGSIGGWSDSGDTHVCTVSFTVDGTYNLSVACTDKAGNAAEAKSVDEFVVDLTAPHITFSLAEDGHAYSREMFQGVAITYEDEANLDTNALTHSLSGAKHGARADIASSGPAASGNSATDTYSADSFPDVVESDDIYTLTAHMTDMAGNEADGTITFSLNRWGSNFIVLDAEKYEKEYLDEAPEVIVREINVTGASSENQGVSITQGLSTENLEQITASARDSKGFYIQASNDGNQWAQYDYHIVKRNFAAEDSQGNQVIEDGNELWADGNYHVIVNSTDDVGNANTSAHYYDPDDHDGDASAEVSFILDTTPPTVDGFNIGSGGMYGEGEMVVSFTVTDNIGVKGVDAVVSDSDGETEYVAEPSADGNRYEVTVPAKSWNSRSMQVIATDYAGNTNLDRSSSDGAANGAVADFKVTTDFIELHLPFVIGGAVVVVAAVVGGVYLNGRRRRQD